MVRAAEEPPAIAPLTVKVDDGSTVHVWLAPSTSGGEIVMFPDDAARLIPSVVAAGAIASDAPTNGPGAMVTEVTPAGLAVNFRSLIVKTLSIVVEIAGPL